MDIPTKGIEDVGIGVSVGGNGVAKNCTIEGPGVGSIVCVSLSSVQAKVMLVSTTFVGLNVGVDMKSLQDVKIAATRDERIIALPTIFTFPLPLAL